MWVGVMALWGHIHRQHFCGHFVSRSGGMGTRQHFRGHFVSRSGGMGTRLNRNVGGKWCQLSMNSIFFCVYHTLPCNVIITLFVTEKLCEVDLMYTLGNSSHFESNSHVHFSIWLSFKDTIL